MGLFERYLSVWIGLAIVAGVGPGALFPGAAASIAGPGGGGVKPPV